jgi:hypothetical protein
MLKKKFVVQEGEAQFHQGASLARVFYLLLDALSCPGYLSFKGALIQVLGFLHIDDILVILD